MSLSSWRRRLQVLQRGWRDKEELPKGEITTEGHPHPFSARVGAATSSASFHDLIVNRAALAHYGTGTRPRRHRARGRSQTNRRLGTLTRKAESGTWQLKSVGVISCSLAEYSLRLRGERHIVMVVESPGSPRFEWCEGRSGPMRTSRCSSGSVHGGRQSAL